MLNPETPWLADGYRPCSPEDLLDIDALKDYALLPDEEHKSFVKLKISNPPCLSNGERRVKSATARIVPTRESDIYDEDPPTERYNPQQRPTSSLSFRMSPHTNYKSMMGKKVRRVKSAGSVRCKTPTSSRFTIVNKLYEDEARKATINFHPHPDNTYASRHSRCFSTTPRQTQFVLPRPHSALETRKEKSLYDRPPSAASFLSRKQAWEAEPSGQTQRYIDYHRPTTAPSVTTRQDHPNVRIYKQNYLLRGLVPHFCNFVQQVQLHPKQDGVTTLPVPPTPVIKEPDSDEDEGIGLVAESQDESGNWLFEELGEPGIKGRPSTPCLSTDGVNDRKEMEDNSSQWNGPTNEDMLKKSLSKSTGSHEQENNNSLSTLRIPSQQSDVDEKEHTTIIKIPTTNKDMSTESKTTLSDSLKDLFPSLSEQSSSNKSSKSNTGKQKPPTSATRRRRSCTSKKEKKVSERPRKKKTDKKEKHMEDSAPIKIETDIKTSINTISSDTPDIKPDIKVPELPTYKTEEKVSDKKPARKPSRHKIETPPKVSQTNCFFSSKQEQLEFEMKSRRLYEYAPPEPVVQEEVQVKKSKALSWDKVRMALSQQSSRFELPMDMKILEKMTPQEYLKKFCIISSRRTNLYQKIFQRHKDKFGKHILYKELSRALKDVLVNTITQEKIKEVCEMLEIDENTEIDYKLFSGVAALSERLLYSSFVTEDTIDMAEYQREKIECADFCALEWKFHGVDVNPPIRKLLKALS